MRPIPILTALLTVAVLFMLVFQREMVRDFVGPGSDVEAAVEEDAPTDETPDASRISVIAMRSAAQEIDSAVVVRGETEATRSVTLMSEASGRVIAAPVAKGDAVAEGDVLCSLDPGTREVALKQAQAQLTEAEQNLNAAEKLSEGGFAAETRVLSARSAFEAAQSGVEQAEAALDDLDIRAPFSGLIEDDPAEIGALLQPGPLRPYSGGGCRLRPHPRGWRRRGGRRRVTTPQYAPGVGGTLWPAGAVPLPAELRRGPQPGRR